MPRKKRGRGRKPPLIYGEMERDFATTSVPSHRSWHEFLTNEGRREDEGLDFAIFFLLIFSLSSHSYREGEEGGENFLVDRIRRWSSWRYVVVRCRTGI